MKDGTTHLAYKPERAVDLDTGVVVASPIHSADEGDTTTLSPTLEAAACNLAEVGLAPSEDEPCVLVADKGYHARDQLRALDGGVWKTRVAEPEPANGYLRGIGTRRPSRAPSAADRRESADAAKTAASCPRSRGMRRRGARPDPLPDRCPQAEASVLRRGTKQAAEGGLAIHSAVVEARTLPRWRQPRRRS